MSRSTDPAKMDLWRDRCDRCRQSGMTTAEFCQAEGVTVASFYAWRRKLGLSTPRRTKRAGRTFQQLIVNPTAPALSARLPGGVQIEVPAAQESALRTVVNELVRASRLVEGV